MLQDNRKATTADPSDLWEYLWNKYIYNINKKVDVNTTSCKVHPWT